MIQHTMTLQIVHKPKITLCNADHWLEQCNARHTLDSGVVEIIFVSDSLLAKFGFGRYLGNATSAGIHTTYCNIW